MTFLHALAMLWPKIKEKCLYSVIVVKYPPQQCDYRSVRIPVVGRKTLYHLFTIFVSVCLCFEVLGQSVEIRTAKGQEQDPDPRIAIPITGIVLDDATGQPFVKEEGKMLPMVRILENNVRVWVNSKGEFSFKGVFTSVGTLRVSYTVFKM
jgi:hypothetical protein